MVFQVKEDIDEIQRLKILIDYDDNGYLLQVQSEAVSSLTKGKRPLYKSEERPSLDIPTDI